MKSILARMLTNPHTSSAALVYVVSKVIFPILRIWLPSHAAQIDATEPFVENAAVGYGLLMAGDAGADASKQQDPPKPPTP